MSMPKQKPGRSHQSYATPPAFLDAVETRFGELMTDLACTHDNCVGHSGFYVEQLDSLAERWPRHLGLCWLNPPFANITPWAKKCAEEPLHGARIAMLVPASIGTNWFANHVHGKAYVLALRPRLTFVGCKDPYPKDLMLCLYSQGLHGFDTWDWSKP